ncbi:Succinyl-CoA:(R)-benzylsuccinate CoA-transferase subunit BbsF [Geodia barretti]|uniref:Succinyl-CoA:(R)-benzylsuccinate CoA-transferase subunit BbsF n=1 Tax=Geodia barretti TaxID=519541 RepID=A0AA35S4N6_GEOBA|nr:Succinyl-CoA:(R)-benzylsuccinate CoA-transferase subunit BbsF [Geodia barretti]
MVAVPYCGALLASLGVRRGQVESPKTGDPSRRRGPFPVMCPTRAHGTFLYLNTANEASPLDIDDPKAEGTAANGCEADVPRQWEGLARLLGEPEWASPEKFRDPATHGPAINENLRQWTAEHTREWLYREGQAYGAPIAPYLTPSEVFQSPQQREREFFVEILHPEAGSYEYTDLPLHMGETPPTLRRVPMLGEHNAEVFGGLGYSPQELTALARAEVI